MKLNFILFLSAALCLNSLYSQNQVEVHLSSIDSDLIGQVTVGQDDFLGWVDELNEDIEVYFAADTTNFEVAIMFHLSRAEGLEIQYASRPYGTERKLDKLVENLKAHEAPEARYMPYTFILIAAVNQGSANDHQFKPLFSYPYDVRIEAYKKLDRLEMEAQLHGWIENEVLPMVYYYESIVDTSFEGVLGIAEIIKSKSYKSRSVEDLTDLNPTYWLASQEMSVGYQIVPLTKICFHILKGEYAKAERLYKVIGLFMNEKSFPYAISEELGERLDILIKRIDGDVDEANLLRKTSKEQAIQKLRKLHDDFPKIPSVIEWYYDAVFANDNRNGKEMRIALAELRRADLIFDSKMAIENKTQAYQNWRRSEVKNIFLTPDDVKEDYVYYADILIDCEDYSLAAQAYWLILNYFDKEQDYENRDILGHFLYCLDQLGITEVQSKFKGEFKGRFKTIAKERQKLMKESSAYKNWKKGK